MADCQRWFDGFAAAGCAPRPPREGDLLLAAADAAIAAQNTVVAAESFGLGSCYIGDILENCEDVRSALALPPYAVPAAMLVLGRPTQQQRERRKPARFDARYIVRENRYRRMTPEEHEAMYRAREAAEGRADVDLSLIHILENVVKVRTGEEGVAALQDLSLIHILWAWTRWPPWAPRAVCRSWCWALSSGLPTGSAWWCHSASARGMRPGCAGAWP